MNKTWECRICRSTELQVEEHPFCPNCSHEHDWEDEVEAFFLMDEAPDHRFHGNTFTCSALGISRGVVRWNKRRDPIFRSFSDPDAVHPV